MRSLLLAMVVLFGGVANLLAQFDVDFHRRFEKLESERQFAQEAYAEARELFLKLAENTSDQGEKAALLARAAIALGAQEGKFDQAMSEVARIDHEIAAHYARITLMSLKSDWAGIIETYGDMPIMEWTVVRVPARPRGGEEELRTLALLKRARAFEETEQYERAAQDMEAASYLIVSRHFQTRPGLLSVLTDLAALRSNRLNDPAGAFEANKRIAEMGSGGARYYRGTLNAAAYLRDQERYDEALEIITGMNPRNLSGSWYENTMLALARALVQAGKSAEAIETFKEIAERPNVSDRARGQAMLNWAETLADSGQADQARAVYRRIADDEGLRKDHRDQATAALGDG